MRPLEGWIWIESIAEPKGNGRSVALACLGTHQAARSRRHQRRRMRRARRCRTTALHPPRPHVRARHVCRCRPWCPAPPPPPPARLAARAPGLRPPPASEDRARARYEHHGRPPPWSWWAELSDKWAP
jgi:hypothetical protein